MAPIEEKGALWVFDASKPDWSLLSPSTSTQGYPAARSYHCMANDGEGVLFLHAGCPASGRLSDLWAFYTLNASWKQLASAPDPARGGTSIAFLDGLLYRMNGFDGKTEQGGSLDVYSPELDTWNTFAYPTDGVSGPEARSVAALVPLTVSGKPSLVTLFGERDPSSLGHQGAGKMLSDVWVFDIKNNTWQEVRALEGQDDNGSGVRVLPTSRGWFAADAFGKDGLVVQGGLGESNERLDDAWLLQF